MAGMQNYISPPISLPSLDQIYASGRVIIEFSGIDQAGPSFEARVFLNNPEAVSDTPTTPENGYAGSFHVYGYGLWPRSGTEPVVDPKPALKAAQLPMRRALVATEAVLRAAAEGPSATVTVVPVLPGTKKGQENGIENFLTIDGVSIYTDASADESTNKGKPSPN